MPPRCGPAAPPETMRHRPSGADGPHLAVRLTLVSGVDNDLLSCGRKVTMKTSKITLALALLSALCLATPASAAIIPLGFSASIDSGTLAGTKFQGTIAYDNAGLTGVGAEYAPLTAIDFVLDGVQFNHSDITQGGQVITLDGAADYFTASFFPAPQGSPVTDITFGFGGPGVIGTFNSSDDAFGTGTYVLVPISIPEPMTILLFGAGLAVAFAMRRRMKTSQHS
jgi:PEP-CTERM motif